MLYSKRGTHPTPIKGRAYDDQQQGKRMSEMDGTSCFARNEAIVARRIGDEFILVPIRQRAGEVDSIYTLNEVGALIWELLDGQTNLGAIRDAIVEEFEVSPEQAEADLMAFVGQLASVGAIVGA